MRLRAIFCCLYFGFMPWQVYEPTRHYDGGYLRHMWLNIKQVFIWLTFRETSDDIDFEREVNASWSFILGKLFRWQNGAKNKKF